MSRHRIVIVGASLAGARSRPTLDRRRRKSWRRDKTRWDRSGKRAEKRHDLADLDIRERDAQLNTAHHFHRFVERRHRPIVEIRRRHCYVPETWNLEDVEIRRVLGESEAALVNLPAPRRFPVLFRHSELLKHLTPDTRPVVAGSATAADEPLQAAPGHWGERLRIPAQIRIEWRGSQQPAFVGANRLPDVRRRDRLGLALKRLLE